MLAIYPRKGKLFHPNDKVKKGGLHLTINVVRASLFGQKTREKQRHKNPAFNFIHQKLNLFLEKDLFYFCFNYFLRKSLFLYQRKLGMSQKSLQ